MKDEAAQLGRLIYVLNRYRRSFAGRELEQRGIKGCQAPYLLALYRRGGMSQEQIADVLKTEKTTTAKALKKLAEAGLVTRQADAADRRANRVLLTPKGAEAIPDILATMQKWDDAVLADISEEEYRTLERLLRRMAERAREILED